MPSNFRLDPFTVIVCGLILAVTLPVPYLMYPPTVAFGQLASALFLVISALIYTALERQFGGYYD